MDLPGWNVIPQGYGARFDVAAAPLWLRTFFRTPLIDRFAYPLMVRRGYGYLAPSPARARNRDPFPSGGWRLEADDYVQPGSVAGLHERDRG
jgi:hypothetical protein